jgi:hypothetical protein
MSRQGPALTPRDLNKESGLVQRGVVQTERGPVFRFNVVVEVPLRESLQQTTNEGLLLIIRECEAALARRGEKHR